MNILYNFRAEFFISHEFKLKEKIHDGLPRNIDCFELNVALKQPQVWQRINHLNKDDIKRYGHSFIHENYNSSGLVFFMSALSFLEACVEAGAKNRRRPLDFRMSPCSPTETRSYGGPHIFVARNLISLNSPRQNTTIETEKNIPYIRYRSSRRRIRSCVTTRRAFSSTNRGIESTLRKKDTMRWSIYIY